MNVLSQSELEARERLVHEALTDDFAELIRIAGLDPKKHLRFADWSGVDFSGCDLRGFDFTGAKLIGCKFKEARIAGARFDQVLIDEVRPGAKLDPTRTDLRKASDCRQLAWDWKRAEMPTPEHLPPGVVFQDAPFAPEMVVVPSGRFWMGSRDGEGNPVERPRHEVTIPRAFAVGRFPVTFDEWDVAVASGGVQPKPGDSWGRERQPIIKVSWADAKAYAAWLSDKTGKLYRLLSEAEWEYACRAETETAFSFGDAITRAQAQFWVARQNNATVDVGSFLANDFGLYDMHGNVQEWCEDSWHDSYALKPESLKETGGAWTNKNIRTHVLRGGSWCNDPQGLHSAKRYRKSAERGDGATGFRVGRTLLIS